jgi:hypothetical protein
MATSRLTAATTCWWRAAIAVLDQVGVVNT